MATEAVKGEPLSDRAKSILDVTKDSLTVLRDLFLLLLFVGFFFFPKALNGILSQSGITQINGGVFEWKSQVQAAANQNASAAQDTTAATAALQDLRSDLQQIESSSNDPALRQAVSGVATKLNDSLSTLDKANSTLAASYMTQQSVLRTAATATGAAAAPAPSVQGWVFLGEADSTHTRWVTPPQPKISSPSPAVKSGDSITFTDDVFIHSDSPSGGFFNQGPVLGAVRAGSSVQILQVQPSHARNGGDFLWVRINAPQAK